MLKPVTYLQITIRKCSLWLLLLLLTTLRGVASELSHVDGLPAGCLMLNNYPFILCQDYGVTDDLDLSDSLFNQLAIGIQFKVNRTEVERNQPFFDKFNDDLTRMLREENYQIVKLFIRGAASPEGPYENNRRLGRGRTDNLFRVVETQLGQTGKGRARVKATAVTEDYAYLVDLMREAGDADAEAVAQLMADCQWDEPRCKKALQQMRGGVVWKRLLAEYFPRLRAARVVLLLRRQTPEPPAKRMNLTVPAVMAMTEAPLLLGERMDVDLQALPAPQWRRRHLLAVRTNLLHDAFYMPQFGWAFSPNVQLEYYPLNGHYTYNVGMTWGTHRHWGTQEFFQVRDFQFELRRYFRGGGVFRGLYAGVYAQGDVYGIGLSGTKGWEGEGGGAGLSLGYVVPLNRKGYFRLEFMAAAGFFMTLYDPYVYGNPVTGAIDDKYYYDYFGSATSFKKRNHRFTWFGPTNVGIQLTYDILYRKRRRVN